MKKVMRLIASFVMIVSLSACGSGTKENSEALSDSTQTAVKTEHPYADSSLRNTFSAKLAGKNYDITIVRNADKNLPLVTDELGKKFYDNRVDVTISCEGKVWMNKSYTKNDFAALLSESETRGTVLLGMAFDAENTNDKVIRLGAQIGQVGIEEGPAFSVEIPLDGGSPKVARDRNQDITGDAGMTE